MELIWKWHQSRPKIVASQQCFHKASEAQYLGNRTTTQEECHIFWALQTLASKSPPGDRSCLPSTHPSHPFLTEPQ